MRVLVGGHRLRCLGGFGDGVSASRTAAALRDAAWSAAVPEDAARTAAAPEDAARTSAAPGADRDDVASTTVWAAAADRVRDATSRLVTATAGLL